MVPREPIRSCIKVVSLESCLLEITRSQGVQENDPGKLGASDTTAHPPPSEELHPSVYSNRRERS